MSNDHKLLETGLGNCSMRCSRQLLYLRPSPGLYILHLTAMDSGNAKGLPGTILAMQSYCRYGESIQIPESSKHRITSVIRTNTLTLKHRHSRGNGNPELDLFDQGQKDQMLCSNFWIPAYAGMTNKEKE